MKAKNHVVVPRLSLNSLEIAASFFLLLLSFSLAHSQNSPVITAEEDKVIIQDAKDNETFSIGKSVVVRGEAKEVLVLGGDVIVEGRVWGDVATIGGSVIQKQDAYIGGDVIVFGGSYKSERSEPLREEGKKTIIYAGYEQELRRIMQNPSEVLSNDFTPTFFALRIFAVLFWFIISLAFTTIAPGAIGRAVETIQISTLRVSVIGFLGILFSTIGLIAILTFLPNYVSAIVGLMVLFMLVLAYVVGRTTLQVVFGKWIARKILPEKWRSESIALLIGAFIWTLFLSIPYLWPFALLSLMAVSTGLVLTARSEKKI